MAAWKVVTPILIGGPLLRRSVIHLQKELVKLSRLSFPKRGKNNLSQLVIGKAMHSSSDSPVYTSLISHYRVIAEACPSSSWCINLLK